MCLPVSTKAVTGLPSRTRLDVAHFSCGLASSAGRLNTTIDPLTAFTPGAEGCSVLSGVIGRGGSIPYYIILLALGTAASISFWASGFLIWSPPVVPLIKLSGPAVSAGLFASGEWPWLTSSPSPENSGAAHLGLPMMCYSSLTWSWWNHACSSSIPLLSMLNIDLGDPTACCHQIITQ